MKNLFVIPFIFICVGYYSQDLKIENSIKLNSEIERFHQFVQLQDGDWAFLTNNAQPTSDAKDKSFNLYLLNDKFGKKQTIEIPMKDASNRWIDFVGMVNQDWIFYYEDFVTSTEYKYGFIKISPSGEITEKEVSSTLFDKKGKRAYGRFKHAFTYSISPDGGNILLCRLINLKSFETVVANSSFELLEKKTHLISKELKSTKATGIKMFDAIIDNNKNVFVAIRVPVYNGLLQLYQISFNQEGYIVEEKNSFGKSPLPSEFYIKNNDVYYYSHFFKSQKQLPSMIEIYKISDGKFDIVSKSTLATEINEISTSRIVTDERVVLSGSGIEYTSLYRDQIGIVVIENNEVKNHFIKDRKLTGIFAFKNKLGGKLIEYQEHYYLLYSVNYAKDKGKKMKRQSLVVTKINADCKEVSTVSVKEGCYVNFDFVHQKNGVIYFLTYNLENKLVEIESFNLQ